MILKFYLPGCPFLFHYILLVLCIKDTISNMFIKISGNSDLIKIFLYHKNHQLLEFEIKNHWKESVFRNSKTHLSTQTLEYRTWLSHAGNYNVPKKIVCKTVQFLRTVRPKRSCSIKYLICG